jgi:gliding motility-associated lipoprotein GldH
MFQKRVEEEIEKTKIEIKHLLELIHLTLKSNINLRILVNQIINPQTFRKEITRIRHNTREENLNQMVIVIKNSKRLILILGIVVAFVSCDSNSVFDQYISLKKNSWSLADSLDFKVQISDTLSRNNVFINIRNNKEYQFSNLYLITHVDFPNGKKIVDTLQYEMTDKNGKFLGNGISEIKHSKLLLKENIIFPISGQYSISIWQAMRRNGAVKGINKLHGISDVGLRIEKVN